VAEEGLGRGYSVGVRVVADGVAFLVLSVLVGHGLGARLQDVLLEHGVLLEAVLLD